MQVEDQQLKLFLLDFGLISKKDVNDSLREAQIIIDLPAKLSSAHPNLIRHCDTALIPWQKSSKVTLLTRSKKSGFWPTATITPPFTDCFWTQATASVFYNKAPTTILPCRQGETTRGRSRPANP